MGQGGSKSMSSDPLHRVKGQLNKNTTTLSKKIVEKNKLIKTKENQLLKVQTERQMLMNQLEYLKQTNVKSTYQLQFPVNNRRVNNTRVNNRRVNNTRVNNNTIK